MLILEARNIKKYYRERLILEIDELELYSEDRVGIVGLNGAGKTTLINILAGKTSIDEGTVRLHGPYSYITQLEEVEESYTKEQLAGQFGVRYVKPYMSGGEKTRLKIAQSFSRDACMLFADEPTCNLDMKGIRLLEEKLKAFRGGMLIVSHDRALMDNICNKILQVENGKIKIYNGNYSDYKMQKEMEVERQYFEYEQYVKEKRKLERAIIEKREKIRTMKDTPSRMGNSEARLYKNYTKSKKAKLDRAVKAIESRIEHQDKKEKPRDIARTKIDIQQNLDLYSQVVIECDGIGKSFGNRILFEKSSFKVENRTRTAIIGDNGTGKTTLVKMILSGEEGIRLSRASKVGYFSQSMDILDNDKTILENVMEESIYDETFGRIILARLLFREEDVYKKVGVLSGGERVKASFAKIFLKDINMIILDEPSNYLDVYSQEALEKVLMDYEGTLLFISHDRQFIGRIADHLLIFENNRIISFNGTYDEYINKQMESEKQDSEDGKMRLMRLENRLSEVIGRLSMSIKGDKKNELEEEYKRLLEEIKNCKVTM